ncbi:MAG TPA: transglycosylase family protein [Solirubrobacteraceae bacterium]|nr:transglycosylase family protein [Solirubrobacteraceae bacterium]
MNFRRRMIPAWVVAGAATGAAVLGLALVPIASSADPSLGQLHSQLGAVQAHESSLAASISSLSGLISSLDSQIALVESREAEVRADLAADRAKLAAVQRALTRERRLLAMLRARLARARMLLSRQLVSNYEQSKPNLVSVVLESNGFTDLLDKITYLKDAQQAQQAIITVTKQAKAQADAAAAHLAALQATDRQITSETAQRVRALAGMNMLLRAKEGALQQARDAKQNALSATRARGAALQSEISRVEAAQAAAERAAALAAQQQAAANSSAGGSGGSGSPTPVGPSYGPSGGWAIPYAIVLCESGGQNLTPNSAGASGYYQIMPATWKLFGGTGPAAYLASKAEQDAVASRIWNGGAGASNWVCAGIVGIH